MRCPLDPGWAAGSNRAAPSADLDTVPCCRPRIISRVLMAIFFCVRRGCVQAASGGPDALLAAGSYQVRPSISKSRRHFFQPPARLWPVFCGFGCVGQREE